MHAWLRLSTGAAFLGFYLVATLLIGWLAQRRAQTVDAYLDASRSLPLWIVTAAYLASNCGALEIIGLSAMAAQYGAQAFHFYWVGAIPAMVFLALVMMPVYRRSGIRTVPEYLALRFGPNLQLLNAGIVALVLLLLAGISLYAMGQTLLVLAGMSFFTSISLSAMVVLIYVLLGGIKATIYNEVFQLLVIFAGIAPLVVHVLRSGVALQSGSSLTGPHLWIGLPLAAKTAPLDIAGVALGLGFVLSFSYWCTDFVLMQRAFTARTDAEARQVPLWAGFGKIVFSFIVVVPGIAAAHLIPSLVHEQRFDQALPQLMALFYGPTMLGLGLTALTASLMSGLASNVSGFASILTNDLYRAHLRPDQPDHHYFLVGRLAAVAAILIAMSASYIDFFFRNLMEHVQLIFSIFGSPFWAIFLLGMISRRLSERGAIMAFLTGTLVAILHLVAFLSGKILYGSIMSANFYTALYSFSATILTGWVASQLSADPPDAMRTTLTFASGVSLKRTPRLIWLLSCLLLAVCLVLNIIWR